MKHLLFIQGSSRSSTRLPEKLQNSPQGTGRLQLSLISEGKPMEDTASCTGGHTRSMGDVCWSSDDGTRQALSTCCQVETRDTIHDLDSDTTFHVSPPAGHTAVAFGPPCPTASRGPQRAYNDDSVYNITVILPPGEYYMHAGDRNWDGSFWEVFDATTGTTLAGGAEAGSPRGENDGGVEDITTISIRDGTTVFILITTYHRSGIEWVLNTEETPGINRPCSVDLRGKSNQCLQFIPS